MQKKKNIFEQKRSAKFGYGWAVTNMELSRLTRNLNYEQFHRTAVYVNVFFASIAIKNSEVFLISAFIIQDFARAATQSLAK